MFDLNAKKRVTIRKYKGQVLVDLREYWQPPGQDVTPTKKGVCLTLVAYETLKRLIPQIDEQIN